MFARALLLIILALFELACTRRASNEAAVGQQPHEDDREYSEALDSGPARGAARPCTVEPTRWLVHPSDAGTGPAFGYEGGALVRGAGGDWAAWLDRGAGELVVAPPTGTFLREALGPGEQGAPALATVGNLALVVRVIDRQGARMHRALVAMQGALRELFTQREDNDDGLNISVATSSAGVLIAWDEDRGPGGGAIVTQFVPRATLEAQSPITAPALRVVTPPDQDAGDPLLVPLPDGGAALFWLASQDLDAFANQTPADIYARTLAADGTPVGPPVRITPGPSNRFGLTALATGGAVWLAYRVAADADQESGGDGGAIALVRLGSDLRPTVSPTYLSGADAVPSGRAAIVPEGAGVAVFWAERDGEGLRTLRRSVEADGRVLGPALVERELGGEVPALTDGTALLAVIHGPRGEPGIARWRCPTPAR